MEENKPVLSELLGSLVSRLDNLLSSPPPPTEPYSETETRIIPKNKYEFILSNSSRLTVETKENTNLVGADEIYKDMVPNIEYLSKKKKIDLLNTSFVISITNLPIPFPPFLLKKLLSIFGKIENVDFIKNINLNPFGYNFIVLEVRSIYTIMSIKIILRAITFNFNNSTNKLQVHVEDFTRSLIETHNTRLNNNTLNKLQHIEKTISYITNFFNENNYNLQSKIESDIEYSEHCSELLWLIEKGEVNTNVDAVAFLLSTIKDTIKQMNNALKDRRSYVTMCIDNKKFTCNRVINVQNDKTRIVKQCISLIPITAGISLEENMREIFSMRLDLGLLNKYGVLNNEIYNWLIKLFYKHFGKNMEDVAIRILEDVKNGIHPEVLIRNARFIFKRDADIFVFSLWKRIHFEINYMRERYK